METKLTAVVGIREVTWGSSSFLINHSPFYFRGFGRHEDSDFRGKGLDLPLVARHGTTSRPIWICFKISRTKIVNRSFCLPLGTEQRLAQLKVHPYNQYQPIALKGCLSGRLIPDPPDLGSWFFSILDLGSQILDLGSRIQHQQNRVGEIIGCFTFSL